VPVGPFAAGASVSPSAANNVAIYTGTATIGGLTTANNGVLATSGSGVPSITSTLPSGLTIPAGTFQLIPLLISGLPVVTSANKGQLAWATDCLNGNQPALTGTGCIYSVNDNGAWTPNPSIPTIATLIGGQSIIIGGATINQGTGSKIQTATGTTTAGNCPQYDSTGALGDSGAPCGGGSGGSGTVTAANQNSIPFYSLSGSHTTLAGTPAVNNAVLITSGSGVPSEATTLPTGLTIPTATVSNPAITGTGTYITLNGSGKLSTAASTTTIAGLNLGAGVAPTSPVNGDVWATNAALVVRINGASQTMLSTINTTPPLGGGGVGPTLTLTCITCARTTNGGFLTAAAPMGIDVSGVISLGTQPAPITWIADSTTVVHNDTYNLIQTWPWTNPGTIDSVTYFTGGTGTPSFVIAVQVNGVNANGCTGITVSSATPATTSCGTFVITNGQKLSLVITGTAGSPSSSTIQINYHKPAA